MRRSSIAALITSAAAVGAGLGAALASVDLTGTWTVVGSSSVPDFGIVEPFTERWSLTQTGTQLTRSVDGGSPANGSIDPDSGVFHFDLGPVGVPGLPDLPSCGHAFVDGTASPDSQSFTGSDTGWFFKITPPLPGCHAIFGTFTGTRACGDGTLDPDEQCDDGNRRDGDCCSSTCHIDPDGTACGEPCRIGASCTGGACAGGTAALAGTSCDDHSVCTASDACDGAGRCAGIETVTCPLCERCDATSGSCLSGPRQGCFAGDASTLKLAGSGGGTASWKWRDEPSSLTPADFRTPASDTAYAFCVFAASSLVQASVPPGGMCGGKPCWKQTSDGAAYRAGKAASGLKTIKVAARNGKASIKLSSRGPGLGLPADFGGVGAPLVVQLQAEDGAGSTCWEDRYDQLDKATLERITARR